MMRDQRENCRVDRTRLIHIYVKLAYRVVVQLLIMMCGTKLTYNVSINQVECPICCHTRQKTYFFQPMISKPKIYGMTM